MMNTEKNEIFADGTGRFHYLGGMVRIDFKTFVPGTADEQSGFRIIMPPMGFLNLFQMMERIVNHKIKPPKKESEKPKKTTENKGKSTEKSTRKSVEKQHKNNKKTTKKTSK